MTPKDNSPLTFRCPVQQHVNKKGYSQTHINFGVDFCETFDIQKGDVIVIAYDEAQECCLLNIERAASNADATDAEMPTL